MLQHIAWFNDAPVELDAQGRLTSTDTTVRRRCLVPARAMETRGLESLVFGNLHDADPAEVGNHLHKLGIQIVIVTASQETSLLNLARTAKHLGCYVIVDLGEATYLPEEIRKLIQLADHVVVAAVQSVEKLHDFGVETSVVPDWEEGSSLSTTADLWLDVLAKVRARTPLCANNNQPS